MNPTWHPPEDAEQFIHEVQEQVGLDDGEEKEMDPHSEALESVRDDVSIIYQALFIIYV
jgi:hypothetical protein